MQFVNKKYLIFAAPLRIVPCSKGWCGSSAVVFRSDKGPAEKQGPDEQSDIGIGLKSWNIIRCGSSVGRAKD